MSYARDRRSRAAAGYCCPHDVFEKETLIRGTALGAVGQFGQRVGVAEERRGASPLRDCWFIGLTGAPVVDEAEGRAIAPADHSISIAAL